MKWTLVSESLCLNNSVVPEGNHKPLLLHLILFLRFLIPLFALISHGFTNWNDVNIYGSIRFVSFEPFSLSLPIPSLSLFSSDMIWSVATRESLFVAPLKNFIGIPLPPCLLSGGTKPLMQYLQKGVTWSAQGAGPITLCSQTQLVPPTALPWSPRQRKLQLLDPPPSLPFPLEKWIVGWGNMVI